MSDPGKNGSGGLEVEDLYKSYASGAHEVEVLRGISFTLAASAALGITGPSGSGKSTLLHIIGTLETPTVGEVRIAGACPHRLAEAELAAFRNRNVGFVFQDHHLLPQYSVLDNVLLPTLPLRARGGGGSAADGDGGGNGERARELLAAVGLEARLDHRPAELSGGERQRVAIARALINRPGLLLCDEPTGNLDHRTAEAVSELLFRLHGELENMLIVVTHSQELAARFDRRFELKEGRCSPI